MAVTRRPLLYAPFKLIRSWVVAARRSRQFGAYGPLRLEPLEAILAPNLFGLVAGVIPGFTAMGYAVVAALENDAATSVNIDYDSGLSTYHTGVIATVASDATASWDGDSISTGAIQPDTDAAKRDVEVSTSVADREPSEPAVPASDPDAPTPSMPADSVFTDPLNLPDLNAVLPTHFHYSNGLNAEEPAFAKLAGASAGWSASAGSPASTEMPAWSPISLTAPALAETGVASVPQAADMTALTRMAGVMTNSTAAPASPTTSPPASFEQDAALQTLAQQGLRFEANQGQYDSHYSFVAHGATFGIALNSTNATLLLSGTSPDAGPVELNMHLVGANPSSTAVGEQALPGITNYFGGPGATYTGVVSYAQAAFHNVYAGVDVVYQSNTDTHQLEYNFVVAPHADPGQVALAFSGADQLALDGQGDLVLRTSGGDILQHAPVAFQEIGGARHAVASRFIIDAGNQVHFALGNYDHSHALTIDPTYVYSSYLGGANNDQANAVAVNPVIQNGQERVFVVGSTSSPTFRPNDPGNSAPIKPTLFPGNGNFANAAFAIEVDPTNNNRPIYLDYFGGNRVQVATGVTVDANNNAYLTGYTTSDKGFAVTPGGQPGTLPAWQVAHGGPCASFNAFAIYLDANGNQTYGTFLGGAGDDFGYGIALDNNGSVYVAGSTASATFNVNKAPDAVIGPATPGQSTAGFIARLSAATGAVNSLVYLGGTGTDQINAIATGPGGNVYVAGTTTSNNLLQGVNPSTASFQTALATPAVGNPLPVGGGNAFAFGGGIGSNAFVADLVYNAGKPTPAVTYETYFGGDGIDQALGIAVDPVAGDAYVVGSTTSSVGPGGAGWGAGGNQPVIVQPTVLGAVGGQDAWVAKFDNKGMPNGANPYFVYIAGTGTDTATGIALAPNNNATPYIYVTGTTTSADDNVGQFPATQGPAKLQNFNQGGPNNAQDAFLARLDPFAKLNGNLNPAGSILALSYIGGSNLDSGAGVAFDPWANNLGNAWVVGSTSSNDFRVGNVGGLQVAAGGGTDGFLVSVKP
jgi:hypothetical protein